MSYRVVDHGHFHDTRMAFAYSTMLQKALNFAQTNDVYPVRVKHWSDESFENHAAQFIEDIPNKCFYLKVFSNQVVHIATMYWEQEETEEI